MFSDPPPSPHPPCININSVTLLVLGMCQNFIVDHRFCELIDHRLIIDLYKIQSLLFELSSKYLFIAPNWDSFFSMKTYVVGTYWKRLGVTTEHSHLRLSTLADYAQLVGIYSISDNCVRETTLWLCGQSVGFLSGRTGFESHDRRENFSDMLYSFVATFMS